MIRKIRKRAEKEPKRDLGVGFKRAEKEPERDLGVGFKRAEKEPKRSRKGADAQPDTAPPESAREQPHLQTSRLFLGKLGARAVKCPEPL